MTARIDDGYTRHVGIGDGIRTPMVDFVYRPLRGPDVNEHIARLIRAREHETQVQLQDLADRIEKWETGGEFASDNEKPTVDDLRLLDGHAFKAVYDVVFNNTTPDRVFDRPEPLNDHEQARDDAKN